MQDTTSDSRPWNKYDSMSVARIVYFAHTLILGVYICFRHGFSVELGWVYIAFLSVARVIGSSFQLALLSDPSNSDLLIGIRVLENAGLGMLILIILGLVARIFHSINRNGNVVVKPLYQRLIHMLMLVSLILTIVGGTQIEYDSNKIEYSTTSDASMGLMIAVVVFVCAEVYYLLPHLGLVSPGERRIFIAVTASLPAVAVRLAYACVLVFGNRRGSFGLYVGTALVPEMVVVLFCGIVGVLLANVPPLSNEGDEVELAKPVEGDRA
jgi:hypothetical protein